MIAYTGVTTSAAARARVAKAGVRTLAQPYNATDVPRPRRVAGFVKKWIEVGPCWALDNGVFAMHQRGKRFEEGTPEAAHWQLLVDALADAVDDGLAPAPEWAVLPDIVAGGSASLDLSLRWFDEYHSYPWPWALVVQNGMTPETLPWDVPFGVVFVGGTMEWKERTSRDWCRAAHEHGRLAHIGRVGDARLARWARRTCDADSIDSCKPLWTLPRWRAWVEAIDPRHDNGPLFASL